jgi:DNA invertase Pin-like site-specific DNA recombinase
VRVAGYVRVSTTEQAIHGLSVEAQTEALKAWVKENDHELVDIYTDAGISARCPASKRPELQRMLKDVAERRVDLIIFCKLDRFFRSISEYYKAQEVLEKAGVPWKAIHEDYETQTASGRLKVNIMLSVAQDEADRTGERIKVVFESKKLRGEVCSGKVPVGLKIVDKHLVPSDEAWKVKETFDIFLATRSTDQTVHRSPTGLSRGGIKYLLKNHHFVEAGVITEEVFGKVQHVLECRSQRTLSESRVYLFSGMVYCQGERMEAHTTVANGRAFMRYRTSRVAPMRSISEPKIEAHLLKHLVSELNAAAEFAKKQKEKPVDSAAIKRKMDRLTDLLLRDLITQEKYEQEYRSLQSQLRPVRTQINPKEIISTLEIYKKLNRESKKAFWSNIIERIDFDPASSEIKILLYP